MAFVAVLALILGVVVLGDRCSQYRKRGRVFDDYAFSCMMQYAEDLRAGAPTNGEVTPGTRNIKLAMHYRDLSRKYWSASSSPWVSVPTDPLPPK